ncbi:hypothetical protein E1963_08675 [Extibacter muris]|uniref:Uncharacterized protein n=1 Tax=Extibacter muris TaxID=1796622 RepID=A0A4R4FEL2_9FIRM|nr:hypothetical protein E1963_08675 [Extibacter muris]
MTKAIINMTATMIHLPAVLPAIFFNMSILYPSSVFLQLITILYYSISAVLAISR